MERKVKSWWSEDGQWFCMAVNNGVSVSTVSLTPDEAHELSRQIVVDDPLAENRDFL